MIKWGKEYKPYKKEFRHSAKGDATVFSMPQYHKSKTGDFVRDGFIQVWVNEIYNDFEDGDLIIINGADTYGANRETNGQYVNMTIYCNKVEIIKQAEKKAEPNKDILADDIPDDLF